MKELVSKLNNSLEEIKILRGIMPICSNRKKICEDKGYWNQIESCISDHTEAESSHGICPECIEKLYPDNLKNKRMKTHRGKYSHIESYSPPLD